VTRAEIEGFRTVAIHSADAPLQATFVPDAGMVCCSLRHDDVELLARRGGVRAYAERGSTMGIPLLYPWANRLSGFSYSTAEGVVELARANPLLKLDEHGLPIHGVIPSASSWELLDGPDAGTSAQLRALMRWQRPELLAIFPFPHSVELRARLDQATLTIELEVVALGGRAVPIAFGFHPYMSLPEDERGSWQVALPLRERLLLDAQMIPTGAREPLRSRDFALAQTSWDDAFAGLLAPPVFTLTGAARRIELELLHGYSYAQLYAPAGERFACFEPMTAPTNALISGDALRFAEPGEPFRAAFAISIASVA
jgi:aldose 1-epimerase